MINKNWKELIKPKKIDFVKDKESQTHAELVAEPLESGYGQTLGNMLRRPILLLLDRDIDLSIMFKHVWSYQVCLLMYKLMHKLISHDI